ncbi:hypothetical protein EVAR_66955_1 [Eumeta japonica]|uniref:Uncharacterized protein n=1 Tax=Eumeta variegata TaxID=151549 RepID=A0A4C1ZQV2_EUMVA|nr:hypothetical protein EVAR_66955_1 [Eumeta japonica]
MASPNAAGQHTAVLTTTGCARVARTSAAALSLSAPLGAVTFDRLMVRPIARADPTAALTAVLEVLACHKSSHSTAWNEHCLL